MGQGVWNTGVMYTGQTGTVSVGYPRLAAQRVPKPPGLLGDTSSSSDLYGTFSHTGTHVRWNLIQLETNEDMERDSNKMGTHNTMTISTARAFDKGTQLAASRDKGRHSHIDGNPDSPGKQITINIGTTGDRDGHSIEGCASGLSGHNLLPRGHNTGGTQLIYLHPSHTNELDRQTDLLTDKGSQQHTVSCLNITGNNKVNARSTPGSRVNYMQRDFSNDMGSNQNRLYNDTTDTHRKLGFTGTDARAQYIHNANLTGVAHILETNNIEGHANNYNHIWINTRCTPGHRDNDTKRDYVSDMDRHDTISYNDNTHTDMVVEFTSIDVNKSCNRVDHIIEDSSHNSISN